MQFLAVLQPGHLNQTMKPRRRDRFVQKLLDQIQALQFSCAGYDAGLESEAMRLAACMRVLFHKTASSTPLLAHLKMEDVTMLSSDSGHNDYKGYVAIELNLRSQTPVRCRPRLGKEFVPIPFHEWWHKQTVHSFEGRTYSRRDLVLVAANQEGGAHVDTKVKQFYRDLASGTQGISIDGSKLVYLDNQAPFDQSEQQRAENTHLAMLRQFAHEVLVSASHFRWLERLGVQLQQENSASVAI
jgi:hypothetical protein